MTACIFITGSNGIEVFSDGAAYDEAGVFGHYASKVDLAPHLPAVIFARGGGTVTDHARRMASFQPSFDALVGELPRILKCASIVGRLLTDDPLNIGVIVGGFSESRQEWQAWRSAACMDGAEIAPESFELERLPAVYVEPWPDDESLRAIGIDPQGKSLELTVEGAVTLMEAIRRSPQQLHPDSDVTGCLCGGFIQRTVVTEDVTTTAVVHRWPDVIGERLNFSRQAA